MKLFFSGTAGGKIEDVPSLPEWLAEDVDIMMTYVYIEVEPDQSPVRFAALLRQRRGREDIRGRGRGDRAGRLAGGDAEGVGPAAVVRLRGITAEVDIPDDPGAKEPRE